MARRADTLTSPWFLVPLALVVIVGAFTAVLTIAGDDDDGVASSASTSSSSSSTTSTTAGSGAWFAVLRSDLDTRASAAQFEPTVAPFGDRGRVIDTDEFRTGNGAEPDFYPRPGVLAAVVGPFASAAEATAWCTSERPGQSCTVRQLIPAG